MAKIFINYRRQDSSPHVGRLVDSLERLFKEGEVFRDIKSIVPGENFKHAIDKAIQTFDFILVMIGPDWLSILKERTKGDSKDFVRLEIASALRQEKKVIPVLVGKASMPEKKDLPKDIAALHDINALELTDSNYETDVEKLVEVMGGAKGTFKLFFEGPVMWSFMHQIFLLVTLQGQGYTRSWEVTSDGASGHKVNPFLAKKKLKFPVLKNFPSTKVQDPVVTFLDLKIKPGRYKLIVGLNHHGESYQRPPWFKQLFKSTSFHLYNGETVGFKAILKSGQDQFQKIKLELELESI